MIAPVRRALCGRGRSARELAWVMAGQAAGAIGSVVGVRLLTGALPPAAYGELALGMTLALLAQQATVAPVSAASLRFFSAADERKEFPMFFRSVCRLFFHAAGALSILVVVAAVYFAARGRVEWSVLCVVAAVFALVAGGSSVLDGMQNAARQRLVVAFHDGVAPWLRFLLAVAVVRLTLPSSLAAMSGYAVAAILVFASQFFFFKRRIATAGRMVVPADAAGGHDRGNYWYGRLFAYASPFAMWGLFTSMQMSSDRWALSAFASAADVGYYAALYQIGFYPVAVLTNVMAQLALPVLFTRAGDGLDSDRLESVRRMHQVLVAIPLGLTVVVAVAVFFLHRPLFTLVVAPAYRSASVYLPLVVVSAGLYATGQIASLSFFSGSDTRALLAPKIVTAMIGLVMNYLGAFLLGLKGVVLAGLGFSIIYLMWVLIASRRRRPFVAGSAFVAAETFDRPLQP